MTFKGHFNKKKQNKAIDLNCNLNQWIKSMWFIKSANPASQELWHSNI